MRCLHYHGGKEWMDLDSRDDLRNWKNQHCNGDPRACPYFKKNIGEDSEFKDAWLVIVSYNGRDYWRRVVRKDVFQSAIIDSMLQTGLIPHHISKLVLTLDIKIIHSSDPDFTSLLDELNFSGTRLEDWPHQYGDRFKEEQARQRHTFKND